MNLSRIIFVFVNNLFFIVSMFFYEAFMPYKKEFRKYKRAIIIGGYLFLVLLNCLRFLEVLNNPVGFYLITGSYLLFQLAVVLVVFSATFWMKSFLFLILKVGETLLISGASAIVLSIVPTEIMINTSDPWRESIISFICILLETGLCALMVAIARMRKTYSKGMEIIAYIFIPLSQFLLVTFSILRFVEQRKLLDGFYAGMIVSCAFACVGDLALFVSLRRYRENAELTLRVQVGEMQKQYYQQLEVQQQQIREMQHDINNHLATIRFLTENSALSTESAQYVQKVTQPELLQLNYCHNTVLNALLVNKALACENLGIHTAFSVDAGCDFSGYEDYDLVSIVSNLIDNAMRAAGGNSTDEKRITLTMAKSCGVLTINCINTISGDKEFVLSTDQGKIAHGQGVKILKKLVGKYNGELESKEENGSYSCSLLLFAQTK